MTSPVPAPSAPATPRRTPRNWRQAFLAALADSSNVRAAARKAAISLSNVYKTRRDDPQFARQWLAALCEGYDNLEMDLLCRLRSGETKDGKGRKFDNANAFRLLVAHRQSVMHQRALRDNESEEDILASINAKLDAMRRREAQIAGLVSAGQTGDRADETD